VESLITHRFPLEQIAEGFDVSIRQQGLKVAILPGR
jgi:threonine dehydrogenase-like Zn-dependent dehydrogenase